jgi:hypothetical protein
MDVYAGVLCGHGNKALLGVGIRLKAMNHRFGPQLFDTADNGSDVASYIEDKRRFRKKTCHVLP